MDNRFMKIGKFSGKGATAVICFCLAAVAALGIYSYNKSADELTKELSGEHGSVMENEPVKEAEANAEDVPFTEVFEKTDGIELEQDAFGETEIGAEPVSSDEELSDAAPVYEAVIFDGAAVKPLEGEIINAYSDGELVKSLTLGVWKTHDGIDISGGLGESVKSMAAGTVTSITDDPMMGVTVEIDHGSGYVGYYSNLDAEPTVSEGDAVSAGTVIGTVGLTAESEICEDTHIHFAVKKNGMWTDPAALLSGEGS